MLSLCCLNVDVKTRDACCVDGVALDFSPTNSSPLFVPPYPPPLTIFPLWLSIPAPFCGQHMREAAERRQQLELEHEQALAVLTAKQQEIDLLQKVREI